MSNFSFHQYCIVHRQPIFIKEFKKKKRERRMEYVSLLIGKRNVHNKKKILLIF